MNKMEDMNMFSESLISFETAKLAKEKGFDIECKYFYNKGSNYNLQNDSIIRTGTDVIYEAPTQFFLQKWLREVHKIDVVIGSNVLGYHVLLYERNTGKTINVSPVNLTQFYEEALEIGLLTALKLIN